MTIDDCLALKGVRKIKEDLITHRVYIYVPWWWVAFSPNGYLRLKRSLERRMPAALWFEVKTVWI